MQMVVTLTQMESHVQLMAYAADMQINVVVASSAAYEV